MRLEPWDLEVSKLSSCGGPMPLIKERKVCSRARLVSEGSSLTWAESRADRHGDSGQSRGLAWLEMLILVDPEAPRLRSLAQGWRAWRETRVKRRQDVAGAQATSATEGVVLSWRALCSLPLQGDAIGGSEPQRA